MVTLAPSSLLTVEASMAPGGALPSDDGIFRSWERSAHLYGVDLATNRAPSVLTASEIGVRRDPLRALIGCARLEIDNLYALVRGAGYVVLLCDADGVAVEHRGEDGIASLFRQWGVWLGGVWSEDAEGTNGIGTAIAERRAVTIHRSHHFRMRHKELSCSGAPLFDPEGEMIGVLDVSAIDPRLSEAAHALTGILTVQAGRAIEERMFRERFRSRWVLAVAQVEIGAPTMLLALDFDQRLVGADRIARANLLLDAEQLRTGVSLWRYFARDPAPFRRGDGGDLPVPLAVAGQEDVWPALLTAPEKPSIAHDKAAIEQHTRPRPNFLHAFGPAAARHHARGGLSAGALRRVRDYVEQHLGEHIDLAALAGVAGVSLFHFAREFKQSTGTTPHGYVIGRRIERSREMLARTDLALSEIALLTGFSDQGHFGRHFHRLTGQTPGEFRRGLR